MGLTVLYITEGWSPHDRRFLQAMRDLGHRPFYLPWSWQRPRAEEVPEGVTPVLDLPALSPYTWRAWARALARLVDRVNPDLIHAGPLPWGVLIPALLGLRPLISMSWGSDVLWHGMRKPWLRMLIRWVLARSTLVLTDCRAVATVVHRWGVPWSRVVIFPWGTDLRRFAPGRDVARRAALGFPQDTFVWLHARTWSRYYGLPVALEGFALAVRQEPRMRLLLLGSGPLASWLNRRLQADPFVQARVRVVGAVPEDDLPRYFQAADAYLSVSHSDGSSVTLMQALASGLPVVVSDIPGNREWVLPGQEGFLVPVGDPKALAVAMVRMAQLPEQARAYMAHAARRRAEVQANWSVHVQKLDRAYHMAKEKSQEGGG